MFAGVEEWSVIYRVSSEDFRAMRDRGEKFWKFYDPYCRDILGKECCGVSITKFGTHKQGPPGIVSPDIPVSVSSILGGEPMLLINIGVAMIPQSRDDKQYRFRVRLSLLREGKVFFERESVMESSILSFPTFYNIPFILYGDRKLFFPHLGDMYYTRFETLSVPDLPDAVRLNFFFDLVYETTVTAFIHLIEFKTVNPLGFLNQVINAVVPMFVAFMPLMLMSGMLISLSPRYTETRGG